MLLILLFCKIMKKLSNGLNYLKKKKDIMRVNKEKIKELEIQNVPMIGFVRSSRKHNCKERMFQRKNMILLWVVIGR